MIALGGSVGALLRFAMSHGVHSLLGRGFPYGTLFVNVSGSVLMGVGYAVTVQRADFSDELRGALFVGLLGAFTTFSTFSLETLGLLENGEPFKALINVCLSVGLCLLGCWAGLVLGRQI